MQIPIIVTFDGVEPSQAVEQSVRDQAAKLEKYFERVTSCRVAVACPHKHHQRGKLYSVRIDLTVPEREIVVNREHDLDHSHEDVHVALRDSFRAARRQLQDYIRKLRAQVKSHGEAPHGRVSRMFPSEGYGFVETSDGREIYFHRDSVLKGQFSRLIPGDAVTFVEEEGLKGPNATSVQMMHPRRQYRAKHHAVSIARND